MPPRPAPSWPGGEAMRREQFRPDERIGSTFAAAALFAPVLFGLDREHLCIALLDGEMRLLALKTVPGGRPDAIRVPLRALVLEALGVGARAAVIAHNHPGGQARPSAADRKATRHLADALRLLDIRLIDHLVFGGDGVASFRELGLL